MYTYIPQTFNTFITSTFSVNRPISHLPRALLSTQPESWLLGVNELLVVTGVEKSSYHWHTCWLHPLTCAALIPHMHQKVIPLQMGKMNCHPGSITRCTRSVQIVAEISFKSYLSKHCMCKSSYLRSGDVQGKAACMSSSSGYVK